MSAPIQEFRALTIHKLQESLGFKEPYYFKPDMLYPEASALEAMTDLNFVPAATVAADSSFSHAHQMMKDRGVRMVFAIDADKQVKGLLTASDVLGPRPEDIAQKLGIAQEALLVQHVMTLVEVVEVLSLVDVVHARVGDIVATLRNSGRQHALVVDREPPEDCLMIRGIFSASQIARQLGVPVKVGDLEHTYAQIEQAIREYQHGKQDII